MLSRKFDSGKMTTPKGDSQWMRYAVFGMVCALVIGIFAWSAESGFLELASPHAEDSYYNLLVQGFRAGQLNVRREAPPGLTQLANPYDPAVNTSYVWDSHYQSYDMSYYKGKLYLYFGVTPALVFFWPYVALTSHYLPDKDAVVIFYALGFLVAAGLSRAVWRRYFSEVSVWVVALGILTLGLATGILENLSRCDVYEVARSCGFAFTMLALAAIWGALREPRRQVLWLLLASLAYGLAIGSRPSLLFGVIILLIPVARAWRAAIEPSSRRRAGLLLAAAVGPVMLIGLGLMLYNVLRFDSPFEFGWHYQLTSYKQNTAQQFSLYYLWFNFRFYFLEPMRWSGHFPFLQAVPLSPLPSGYWGVGEPYSGILSNYPLVWLALAAPLAWRGRPAEEVSILRWFVTAVFFLFVTCALTLCLFFAGSCCYELEFLPALMLLAVIGVLGLERALAGLPVWRRVARWGWCLLLAYSVAFNILASVEAHATANYFAGNSLVNQGRLDKALERFQEALALEPESAAFHAGLGNALYKKGLEDEAIIQYQKALEIDPDYAEAHNNLGNSLLQIGRAKEAITHFQRALEIRPDYAEAHNNLGYSLLQAGRVDEAIIQYQKALVLQPESANFHNSLGNALVQKGHIDEAIIQYQKALVIRPDLADAHNNLGNSLLQIGRVDEAIVQYQKALALEPESAALHDSLGNALSQKGLEDEAIIQYQKALEIDPDSAEAHNNLGCSLCQIGRVNEAITHFQRAVEIKPDFAEAHNNLGNCLFQIGRANEAITHFQRALEIKPDYAEAHNKLGYSLFQTGRANEAITHFRRALEVDPDYAEAHNNLGYALFQTGRANEAITHFQRAVEIKPDWAEAHNNLGYSLLQVGRVDEAIIQYQKALALEPESADACERLGNAFRRKGMAAEAMACYQKAIELQPQFIPAQINLAWMLATWPEPSVRNGGKAVALAEQANQFSKDKDPLILRTLAAAYAEAGRFPEAVLTAKQALALAVAQSNPGLTNELQTEIGLYQTNSPWPRRFGYPRPFDPAR